jgi:hypothetical protein
VSTPSRLSSPHYDCLCSSPLRRSYRLYGFCYRWLVRVVSPLSFPCTGTWHSRLAAGEAHDRRKHGNIPLANVCVEERHMASPTSSNGILIHVILLHGCFWLPSVFPRAASDPLKLNAILQARRCRRCFDMFRMRIRRNHAYRLCHVSSLPSPPSTGIMFLLDLTATCDRGQICPCSQPCSASLCTS